MHLHHRLLAIGHSHRRAVLTMYFWAALLSFGAVALSITGGTAELLVVIGVLLAVGVVAVLSPHARRTAREARAAEIAAQRRRSRAAHPTARAARGEARRSTATALPGGRRPVASPTATPERPAVSPPGPAALPRAGGPTARAGRAPPGPDATRAAGAGQGLR
jgi:UDP-GlcNAc:undecaprenyl-phosphate GlcNAc-1-phosphate transferase